MTDHQPNSKRSEARAWQNEALTILKTRKAKRIYAVLASLIFLRLGVNYILGRNTEEVSRSVRISHFFDKDIDKRLRLPGNVEAIEEATLYAHVSGYLKTIKVDEGDHVSKNQLLAIIDAPDVLQEFRNAKAEYDFKETTRKRYEQLLAEKVVSQQEYDKVDADAGQARARFDNAVSNQGYTLVRAPFAGEVARRYMYPGDFISAPTKGGTPSPLFLLVNEGRLRISVNIPQSEVSNVTAGNSVDIKVDSFPDRSFAGKISRIDAQLDEATKTQRILIDMDNPELKLRAGMFASVVLHSEVRDHVTMIPIEALHDDGQQKFVFVAREGKAKKVPVTVGDTFQSFIEVNSPALKGEDQFIVSGGQSVADGDAVKILMENAPSGTPGAEEGPRGRPRLNDGPKVASEQPQK